MRKTTKVFVMAAAAIGIAVTVAYADVLLTGTTGQDSIEFDLGDDFINFDEGANDILFGSGQDTIQFGLGNDLINFDEGTDWIFFSTGDDAIIFTDDWAIQGEDPEWIKIHEDENGTDDQLEIRADEVKIIANRGDIIFVLGI